MFTFYLEREEGYYIVKVLTIIIMLTAISWCTMMIYTEEENFVVAANGTRTMDITRTISVDSFVNRINLSCAVLLACVAFQYLISENLPKTGYMTTMVRGGVFLFFVFNGQRSMVGMVGVCCLLGICSPFLWT